MSDKLTHEDVAKKAEELSKQFGVTVHPIIFIDEIDSTDLVVGYLKEPSRLLKQRVQDKSSITGPNSAAGELLEEILIKEHSDTRIWQERPENDKFYFGACNEAQKLIKISLNQFKKK